MSIRDVGPLREADEGLNHQIVDTFAIVAKSERSWTEKVRVSIARTDGSLQLDFGLGKYHNRGIVDGFGGVSRGREHWTVRGSRELHSAPEAAAIGPIRYEIVEPQPRSQPARSRWAVRHTGSGRRSGSASGTTRGASARPSARRRTT